MARAKATAATFLSCVVLISACAQQAVPPPLTPKVEGALVASAVERACAGMCGVMTPYVYDKLGDRGLLVSSETPMTKEMADAIESGIGGVVFVGSFDAVEQLFGDSPFVDGGAGMLIVVGPVVEYSESVVGVDVGVTRARDDGRGTTFLFSWDGSEWVPTTSEDSGVPVTS